MAMHLQLFWCVLITQVLYIPPLWFHQVTAVTDSVSVSVWSPYAASELYSSAIENAPLPIKASWPSTKRVGALRLLLESLVTSLELNNGDVTAAEFIHWALLENRFKHVGGSVGGFAAPADAANTVDIACPREPPQDRREQPECPREKPQGPLEQPACPREQPADQLLL
eukprot:m.802083 g.802083  ORF g.802083 m.802083 type:complete len:169 (-) comp23361_c1_seq39:448-954(-)